MIGMDDVGETRFMLLDASAPTDDDMLYQLYAYPECDTSIVRGNAIASLDGGATTDGTSGGLGGSGDRHLFAVQRELADVIVVGAGTARAENYGGARMTAAQRQRRQRRGQHEVPPLAVVTRSGVLEHDLPVLTQTEVPPLVITCAANADSARARLGSAAQVIDCSGSDPRRVDLAVTLERLADRGLLRVLSEGGPSLLGAFVAANLLDEICLTSAPLLVGGGAVRITAGIADVLVRMRRAHVIADNDGYLYSRYIRAN
jgi:5-amino-6-(5-phosphoribosylamino)uracil reductase